MQQADNSTKYLGLPNMLGRNKSVVLGYLKDKVKASIQNWQAKNVSKPSKELLIKTVAQALPNFTMNVFLLPLELIKDIEKEMSKFFWNSSNENSSHISWMSWNRMSKHKHAGGLGFKCLRDFNLSMLGKQCWRLITNSDSLVARVYRAKYYAQGEFLGAKLGGSPSFIWRSIFEAKQVISSGACWRIGSGKYVQISNQPWLQDSHNSYISTESLSIVGRTVDSLFQTGTRDWDLEIIRDIFNDRDQRCILNTTVEHQLDRDTLFWKHEQSGDYSVRSAYKLLQLQKGVWNVNNNLSFWKTIWSTKAPPKALHLIWRAANNCLPTKTQLREKHVRIDDRCPVCDNGVESIIHALVECTVAAECWHIFDTDLQVQLGMSFSDWLHANTNGQTMSRKAKMFTLCWSIWRARNDLVWNRKRWSAMKIVAKAWEYLSQWNGAQARNYKVPLQPMLAGDGAIYWAKPKTDVVKITVDAATFSDQGTCGIGIISRDHDGSLLGAKSKQYAEVLNPSMVEAMAIKEALSWAKDRQWSSVILESDCLLVVQLIRSATPMKSRFGQVIEDCRRLRSGFNNFELYFIKRSANMSAHELAQVSHIYPDCIFDWRSVPVKVKHCILNDLNE